MIQKQRFGREAMSTFYSVPSAQVCFHIFVHKTPKAEYRLHYICKKKDKKMFSNKKVNKQIRFGGFVNLQAHCFVLENIFCFYQQISILFYTSGPLRTLKIY